VSPQITYAAIPPVMPQVPVMPQGVPMMPQGVQVMPVGGMQAGAPTYLPMGGMQPVYSPYPTTVSSTGMAHILPTLSVPTVTTMPPST